MTYIVFVKMTKLREWGKFEAFRKKKSGVEFRRQIVQTGWSEVAGIEISCTAETAFYLPTPLKASKVVRLASVGHNNLP